MAVINQLSNQITDLIAQAPTATIFNYEIDVHVGDKIIKPIKMGNMDQVCEYDTNCAEYRFVELYLVDADYTRDVYPYRNDLFITVRKIPVGEMTDAVRTSDAILAKKYRAVITEPKDSELQGKPSYDSDQSFKVVNMQLIDLAVEQLRLQTIGFIARDAVPGDVLKVALSKFSSGLQLDKTNTIRGVDMPTSNQSESLAHVIIPHGTRLIDLARYIQKEAGGIYNYGIGCFLHNQLWYVYPLWDPDRYEKCKRTADLVIVPPNQRPGQERTYAIKDSKLFILSNGETRQVDFKDIDYQNAGNGTRFQLATKTFDVFTSVSENVATADPSVTTAQVKLDDRDSDLNSATFSDIKVTDNVAYEFSKKTRLAGQTIMVQWFNSNPDLLYPGMPFRVSYSGETGERTKYGILIRHHSFTNQANPGMTGSRYTSTSMLTLFLVEKKIQRA